MKPNPAKIKTIRSAVNGYKLAQLLITAEEIGVFRALGSTAATAKALAADTGTDSEHLARALNALTSVGVLSLSEGAYCLSDDWSLLSPDSEAAQGGYLRYAAVVKERWQHLTSALRGKEIAKESVSLISGGSLEATEAFMSAMDANARPIAKFVATNWNFKGRSALDLGGGSAIYPIEICRSHIGFHATVLDLPGVVPIAQSSVDRAALNDRIRIKAGDYTVRLPEGNFDDYFMFAVVHQHEAESNSDLLSRVRQRIASGGRLFISSFFTDDSRTSPPFSAFFGVEMSIMVPGGRAYSQSEFCEMIEGAGFSEIEVVDKIPGPGTLLVATP